MNLHAECGTEFPDAISQVVVFEHEEKCPRCAGFPRGLVRRAEEALGGGFHSAIEIACFNRAEADEVIALLPERIRDRVRVTWLEFGPRVSK